MKLFYRKKEQIDKKRELEELLCVELPNNSVLIYFDSDMDFIFRKALLKYDGVYYNGEVSINLGDYKDVVTIDFPEYLKKFNENIELKYMSYSDTVIFLKHCSFKIGDELDIYVENIGSNESIYPQLKGGEIFSVGPGQRIKICPENMYTYM